MLSGCAGRADDAVRRARDVADTVAVGLVSAPCGITVGAWIRLPDGQQVTVAALCQAIENERK